MLSTCNETEVALSLERRRRIESEFVEDAHLTLTLHQLPVARADATTAATIIGTAPTNRYTVPSLRFPSPTSAHEPPPSGPADTFPYALPHALLL